MAQLPEPDPLIEDVVSLRSVVVMIGETGVGKTFASLGMLGSVTTGRPWLDHKVFQAMPAMHVLGEGAYGWHKRMTAWEAEYNDAAMIPDHMLQVIRQPASLLRQSTWDALTELAQRDGVRFIVFDTLSSLASDADETKDAPVIMRRLTDLANAIDGTVMLLHHPGWTNTGRSRGGSQLEANADEVLVLQKLGGQGTIDDGFTMTRKKVKEGEAGEKYYLRLARRHGSLVVVEDDHKRKHVSETSLILSFLEEHKLLTATGDRRKIAAKAKELGLTPGINKIENALKSWREGGLLDAL